MIASFWTRDTEGMMEVRDFANCNYNSINEICVIMRQELGLRREVGEIGDLTVL